MQVPFTSIYKLRKVADSDSKSCFICYKPSRAVLVSLPSKNTDHTDFFYVCEIHLKDKNFCSVKYIDETQSGTSDNSVGASRDSDVAKLRAKIAELQRKLHRIEEQERNRSSALGTVVGYFTKQKEDKTDDTKEIKDPKLEIADLKKELDTEVSKLAGMEKQYTRYLLDAAIYRTRLHKFHEKEKQKERIKFLQSPSSFPSVQSLPKPGEVQEEVKVDDDADDKDISSAS